MRLKQSELKAYRDRMLKEDGRCRICGHGIQPEEAVLDHDHETGHIRSVLHRNCNQIEGRVLSWCKRNGKGVHPLVVLKGIRDHWQKDYSSLPLHPTHLSDTEKEIQKLKRAMRRVKRASTKLKYKNKIHELQGKL